MGSIGPSVLLKGILDKMHEKQKTKKSKQKKLKRANQFHSNDTLEKSIRVQKAKKICQKRKKGCIGASV